MTSLFAVQALRWRCVDKQEGAGQHEIGLDKGSVVLRGGSLIAVDDSAGFVQGMPNGRRGREL